MSPLTCLTVSFFYNINIKQKDLIKDILNNGYTKGAALNQIE